MQADAKTKAEVLKTVREMWKAYARMDADGVLSFYAPDPDTVVIGSGADEVYVGPKQAKRGLKRDFTQARRVKVALAKVRVSAAGKVAWLAANCLFSAYVAGCTVEMAGRLTMILEKRKGTWLILQSHFAMPYAGQAKGRSFPGAR
ncbi:MAG: nuclear transport factor 2 family protein [Syntrophales bacterium]